MTAETIPLSRRNVTRRRAMRTVYTYMAMCGGAGLVPLPALDQVLVGGLLAKMIRDLGVLYGVPLTDHKAKVVLSAVLGGAHTEWISHYLLTYIDSYAPGLRRKARLFTRPLVSAATAYAVGMLFVHHFHQGAWRQGNCTFQPEAARLPRLQATGAEAAVSPRADP
jgi:hypothetical protein